MSRDVQLNALTAGIQRLRNKGGADPKSLYDLLNGYVLPDGSTTIRPGTRRTVALPAGTRGLCAFNGKFVVFSNVVTDTGDANYECVVLTNPNDDTLAIKEIHFAAPFLGYLYVVAEFSNGDVYHYWLQGGTTWTAGTVYRAGDVVQPTTPNGLAYMATRNGPANPVWTANTPHDVGDVVEPTTYNDYYYTVVEADGTGPTTGSTEPVWPESDGAQVYEDVNGAVTPGSAATGGSSSNHPTSSVRDRYNKTGSQI